MARVKVRCVDCGAKNTDGLADRCRICGGLLPNAAQRRADRIGTATEGPTFNVQVEHEVATWYELERRGEEGPRSRRPSPEDDEAPNRGKWGWRRAR